MTQPPRRVGLIPHPVDLQKQFKEVCTECNTINKMSDLYRGDHVEKTHLFHIHGKSKIAHKKYHTHLGH